MVLSRFKHRGRALLRALEQAGHGTIRAYGIFSGQQFVKNQSDGEEVRALVERSLPMPAPGTCSPSCPSAPRSGSFRRLQRCAPARNP